MRTLAAFLAATPFLAALSLHAPVWPQQPTALRSPQPRCISEMEWRKGQQGGAKPPEESAAPADAKRKVDDRMTDGVDRIEMFGMTGTGGQLTRESIANCQKTLSPAIEAEAALQRACEEAGKLSDAAAAAAMLQQVIGDAFEVGVSVSSPQMRKAAALLGAFETALATTDDEASAAKATTDAHEQKMNALFSDEYAMPDLDLDLD